MHSIQPLGASNTQTGKESSTWLYSPRRFQGVLWRRNGWTMFKSQWHSFFFASRRSGVADLKRAAINFSSSPTLFTHKSFHHFVTIPQQTFSCHKRHNRYIITYRLEPSESRIVTSYIQCLIAWIYILNITLFEKKKNLKSSLKTHRIKYVPSRFEWWIIIISIIQYLL